MDHAETTDPLATPVSVAPARLIVCERTGCWAIALRRELVDAGVRVWETRTVSDGWQELTASPASFVVVELGSNAGELLDRLGRMSRAFPAARAAIVTDRGRAELEWSMREAGAVDFVCSPRRVGTLAQLACRHLAQAPLPQQSITERIWAGLPWGK